MEHSPGQPTKLTEEQRHQLAAMLEQHSPIDVGFEARYTWTLPNGSDFGQQSDSSRYRVTTVSKGASASAACLSTTLQPKP